jgi:hypothetical protein
MATTTKFFVFDLDHTLGDFNDAGHYLYFLKPESVIQQTMGTNKIEITLSDSIKTQCEIMYKQFIKKVAEKHSETKLLNDEMVFGVIGNILTQDKTQINPKFGIYSNNSQPLKLQLAIDIIEELYQQHIFCLSMDWTHPLRKDEIVKDDPGNALKTWAVLKKGLEQECGETPTPENTWFFDDLMHQDLMNVLGPNYLHIKAYYSRPNLEVLNDILFEVLEESGLDSNEEYLDIYGKAFGIEGFNTYDIYKFMMDRSKKQEVAKQSKTRRVKGGKKSRTTKRKLSRK